MQRYCLDYYLNDEKCIEIKEIFTKDYIDEIFLFILRKLKISYYCELAIFWVNDTKAKELNIKYRKKNYIPDVLSFQVDDNLFLQTGERIIGDLFLNFSEMQRKIKTNGNTLKSEGVWCIVHGILHLLGYDHENSKKEEEEMFTLTEEIMSNFNLTYSLK
ncbi:rRNA maturation RNase YbeY [Spiroplasma endosymbiont of Aspidapion aeneum]|uniref:rRNA maturation RNase YbeY n=1 Tax=Spiroplasma endosymbiont of Aspidapion aeneum TaxID=3066276 RepID=UPI00313D4E83